MRIALLALLAVVAATAVGLGASTVATDLDTPRDLHGGAYARSDACRRCHPAHYESWRRTFHRTMTQDASDRTVLGAFDGTTFSYLGVTARMDRDGDRFRMTFTAPGRPEHAVEVVRAVGSHRYQQYLARDGDALYRLPIAWHVEEGRFFHMNGAFLTPDPEEPLSRQDYERHVVRWNDNCVFCHNVGPNPGLRGGRFETEVAELGIACEACHGPGEAHAQANASPLRRYALHLGDHGDPTIMNPARLTPARSADLCGRCHGQRKADDVDRFLREGDPFVPGDDLAHYTEPLFRETTLDGEELFRERFWPDGTARLTAYEYQGLLQSPCYLMGEMTCTSCHGMHEGDPRGQIRPEAEGDRACSGCHAGEDHSGHEEASSGARCVACHMPRIVYGLVDVHVSHRIELPDPARAARAGRPDACTLCHTGRTRQWAIDAHARLWPEAAARSRAALAAAGPADAPAPAPALPELERILYGGDPIERAVAADALGRAPAFDARRLGALLDTMEQDPYPAVRRLAWRAARRIADHRFPAAAIDWMSYEPTARAADRRAAAHRIEAALPPGAVTRRDAAVIAPLRAAARDVEIWIGE